MKKGTLRRKILFSVVISIAAILPLSPVMAQNVGIVVNAPLTVSTQNVYYGNAINDDSDGSLMLLQNQNVDKFRIDRTGKVYAAGPYCDINGNNCLTSGGGTSQWITTSSNIYNSNSGNVGIGTDSPGTKLAIYNSDNSESVRLLAAGGSGSIQGKSSIGFAQFTSAANPSSKIEFREAGTATYNGEIGFFTNNTGSDSAPTEKVTINADGNLGIGITNPSNKLHVYYASNGFAKIDTGAGQVSGVLLAEAGSNKWAIANRSGDSNNLYFSASPSGTTGGNIASAAKMTITQSGNVGIGTTAPGAKLEVIDSSYSLKLGNSLMGSAGPSLLGNTTTHLGTLTNGLSLYGGSSINFNIGSTPSTKMKIDSAGNVGIGTTNPGAKLGVSGGDIGIRAIYSSSYGVEANGGTYGVKAYGGNTGVRADGDLYGVYANGTYGVYANGGSYGIEARGGTTGVRAIGDFYGVYASGEVGVQAFGGDYGLIATSEEGTGISGTGYNVGVRGAATKPEFPTSGYDFYADGTGVNFGPFTGAHDVRLSANFGKVEKGMLVSVTGDVKIRDDSISTTLPEVRLSSSAKDKNVLGALVGETDFPGEWIDLPEETRTAAVNSLGEGRLWITNYGGELQSGDLITTSPIAGYGMLQDDDLMHSYTVGKATQSINWDEISDTVWFDGREYKKALIAVTYHAG